MMKKRITKYKKNIILFISMSFIFCLSGFSGAERQNNASDSAEDDVESREVNTELYYLNDINISVEIPDGYTVLTRETDSDNPWVAMNGLTQSDVLSMLKDNNIYLLAWNSERNDFEVNISSYSMVRRSDIRNYTEEELASQIELLEQTYRVSGYEVFRIGEYQSEETKFIMSDIKAEINGIDVYLLQYATWYGNNNVSISLRSELDELTSYEADFLQHVVDSICFIEETGIDVKSGTGFEQQSYGDITDKEHDSEGGNEADNNTVSYDEIKRLSESMYKTYRISYMTGRMISGAVMGLIPLLIGIIRKQKQPGVIAVGVCAVGAVINPLISLLSAVAAIVIIIMRSRKKP